MRVLIINGSNMNLLGKRDPKNFGQTSLADINESIIQYGKTLDIDIDTFNSNSESEIVNKIQEAALNYDGVIINPGSFVHYSISIQEAIDFLSIPCIEVHISNFFRKSTNVSKIANVCSGFVCGFGIDSYKVALFGIYTNQG